MNEKKFKSKMPEEVYAGRAGWRDIPIAAMIVEPGSSMRYKTGAWRALKPVYHVDKCKKCLLCWVYCPEPSTIIRKEDDTIEINYDYCKGCGICAKVCPIGAIEMVREV